MFDGLDDIPWSRLSHAYGEASDVPGLLRALQDGSEEVRMEALSSLFENIIHQGTVYEATPYAVPFLVEIACDPAAPLRGAVLSLLQEIARGWLDCQEYAAVAPRVAPDVAERWVRERVHYQAAHEAVARSLPDLLPLLGETDPEVRVGASFVLSTIPGERADVAAAILESIDQEENDSCRAGLIFALLELTQRASPDRVTDAVSRRFDEILRSDAEGADSRLAAGIALMRLGRSDAIDDTLALARPRLTADRQHFLSLPWEKTMELFSLIEGSLANWTELRIAWITEGGSSDDRELIGSAISRAVQLCERYRWAPSRMAPLLAKVATRRDGQAQERAIDGLRSLGRVGVEHLQRLQGRSSELDRKITTSLERLRTDQTLRSDRWSTKLASLVSTVPALMRRIESLRESRKHDDHSVIRTAIQELGRRGEKASDAARLLISLFDHNSQWVRLEAIKALWAITHDALLVVPPLIDHFLPQPVGRHAIEFVQEIGPAARDALPALRRIAEADERFITSDIGVCASDEEFQDAALAAIQAIENR